MKTKTLSVLLGRKYPQLGHTLHFLSVLEKKLGKTKHIEILIHVLNPENTHTIFAVKRSLISYCERYLVCCDAQQKTPSLA